MEPVQKMWMYENWVADQNDQVELAKNHAYLLASFDHPETVKKMMGEGGHQSTDEEFEESTNIVKSGNLDFLGLEPSGPEKIKRRRRQLKG